MATQVNELKILISAEVDRYVAALGKAEGANNKLKASTNNLASEIGAGLGISSATIGITALTAGIVALASAAVMASAKFEQYAVYFEVMTGSAEKGMTLLNSIRDFANVTPFTTDDIASASTTLLQFGVDVDQIMPTIRVLGDVSGGNSERFSRMALAFGQASAQGRLMGQDLLQMVNAGFNPLQEISKRTGESMAVLKKRMEDGGISIGEVKQAFVDATSEGGRFFGMMSEKSKTVIGTFSTMQDAWGKAAVVLGDILNPTVKGAISLLTELGNAAYNAGVKFTIFQKEAELKQADTILKSFQKNTVISDFQIKQEKYKIKLQKELNDLKNPAKTKEAELDTTITSAGGLSSAQKSANKKAETERQRQIREAASDAKRANDEQIKASEDLHKKINDQVYSSKTSKQAGNVAMNLGLAPDTEAFNEYKSLIENYLNDVRDIELSKAKDKQSLLLDNYKLYQQKEKDLKVKLNADIAIENEKSAQSDRKAAEDAALNVRVYKIALEDKERADKLAKERQFYRDMGDTVVAFGELYMDNQLNMVNLQKMASNAMRAVLLGGLRAQFDDVKKVELAKALMSVKTSAIEGWKSGLLMAPPPFNLATAAGMAVASAAFPLANAGYIAASNYREMGGPVTAGQSYIVGEKRPEVFVPRTNGTILPNTNGLGGQAQSITIDVKYSPIINTGAKKEDIISALAQAGKEHGALIANIIRDNTAGVRQQIKAV